MKTKFLLTIFLFLLVGKSIGQERPNIIFILTDDQSYGYMGCTGNEIVQTPNLDKLAKDGVLFTNSHITTPICMPSRISMFLSQWERKHGVNFNSGTSVSDEAWNDAYPMQLRAAGYYTGYVGKNHAPVGKGGYESGKLEESFDYWYAGHRHLGFYPKDRHEIFKHAKADTQIEVVGEAAEDFLSNEHKLEGAINFLDKRPTDKPFALSICFNLPHGAGTSSMKMKDSDPELYKSLYRDKEIPLPANYLAKEDIKTPKIPLEIHHVADRQDIYNYCDTPEGFRERYIRQLQAMTGIDQLVGKLRKQLKDQKLDKNTIIVFSSDHGLFMGEFGLGGKSLCYEKCTHVPTIIMDPRMPKKTRGKKNNARVQSIDIAPTILAKAGVAIPDSYQGKDLSPVLSGEVAEVRDYIYTENLWSTQFGNPRIEAVQDSEWKYIRYYKNENFSAQKKIATAKALGIPVSKMLYAVHDPDIALYRDFVESSIQGEPAVFEELYHLSEDPNETTNLIDNATYTAELERLRKAWKVKLLEARGEGLPKVYRYTEESKVEFQSQMQD